MGPNVKGGKNQKKGKNNTNNSRARDVRNIPTSNESEGLFYGWVVAVLGDCRFHVNKTTKDSYIAEPYLVHLAKGARRYGRIMNGSLILYSERSFEAKGDVSYTFNADEVSFLLRTNEIKDKPSNEQSSGTNLGFDFTSNAEEVNMEEL